MKEGGFGVWRAVGVLLAVLVIYAALSLVWAERINPNQPYPVAVMNIDNDGLIACSLTTPGQVERLEYLVRGDQSNPGSFTYSASKGGGIQLEFSGVPNQAKEVIVHAATLWENVLVIDVPFTLRFVWTRLEWAMAKVVLRWKDGPSGSFTYIGGVFYPNPLANQILGRRINTHLPEFEVYVNSGVRWNFSTHSDDKGTGPYLLRTAMHEIGHTVGFISGASIDESGRTARIFKVNGKGFLVFDKFIEGRYRNQLFVVDPEVSVGPRELYRYLTEGLLLWGGVWNVNRHGEDMRLFQVYGTPVVLHTSKTQGVGVSHLNEHVFYELGKDDLMTPYDNSDTAQIGPITSAMLYDMGWHLREESIPEEGECDCSGFTREPTERRSRDFSGSRSRRPGRTR